MAKSADALPIRADEYAVRAALILNLAKFVSGPPERFLPDDPNLHICIVGPPEPLGPWNPWKPLKR